MVLSMLLQEVGVIDKIMEVMVCPSGLYFLTHGLARA
jgi:hypothetical protein